MQLIAVKVPTDSILSSVFRRWSTGDRYDVEELEDGHLRSEGWADDLGEVDPFDGDSSGE